MPLLPRKTRRKKKKKREQAYNRAFVKGGTYYTLSYLYLFTMPALHMSSRAATEVSSALTFTRQDTASLPIVLERGTRSGRDFA